MQIEFKEKTTKSKLQESIGKHFMDFNTDIENAKEIKSWDY